MIILDCAMERRASEGNPIRVGMVGAGYMGRALALQLVTAARGIELVAIANRHGERALQAYQDAGVAEPLEVETQAALEEAVRRGRPAVTEDETLLCRAEGVDAVVEVTGDVEFGARVGMEAIGHGKHVILMNAELDGTLGPILKHHADRAGVVVTDVDGDQPAVLMNLYRFLVGIGVRPVLCGNIKGLQDPYRTPATQESFARQWGQDAVKVTSFADGSKISFEQACVANATGMRVARRGMLGPTVPPGTPVEQAADWYPLEELLGGPGIVDYVIGASPAPGVFILGTIDHPVQQGYLTYYKMGDGPLHCFHTPFHLCHFEVQNSIARAVEFADAAIAPAAGPLVEVVATAKRDLEPGDTLDGIGGYLAYGQCENTEVMRAERLLPIGLSEGCKIQRAVARDRVVSWDDVEPPAGRMSHRLYEEQVELFT
jgi:predicted homoserine dehydrogenase-like protein